MPSIPRRIIQTAKSRELSPFDKAASTGVKLLHPLWDYRFFDDVDVRDFISTEPTEHQVVFDAFPRSIQRIDFFRYLAIYRSGGFYLDLDVLLSDELSPLLGHSSVFPFEELSVYPFLRRHRDMDWEIGNYAFGAAPADPFVQKIIENCVRAQRDQAWADAMLTGIPRLFHEDFRVLITTGPGLLADIGRTELARDVTVLFPADVCDGRTWALFGRYGVHTMRGTWRPKFGRLRQSLRARWETKLRRKQWRESVARGPHRSTSRAPSAE